MTPPPIEPIACVNDVDRIDPLDRRNERTRTGINDDVRRGDDLPADDHPEPVAITSVESRLTTNQLWILNSGESVFDLIALLHHDRPRSIDHRPEVHLHRRNPHSEFLRPAREMRHSRRGDRSFRWRAAEIRTGAAEVLALNERGAPISSPKLLCERNAGLSGTDDDDLVVVHAPSEAASTIRSIPLYRQGV